MNINTVQNSTAAASPVPPRSPGALSSREGLAVAKSGSSATPVETQANGNKPSLEQAVDNLRQLVSAATDAEINFAVDSQSGVQVVKIVDRNTQDVIRQIPSEEAIALAMALDKLQGLFVRDKA